MQRAPNECDQIIPGKILAAQLRQGQRLSVDESACLFRLAHITAMAEALFRNEEKAECGFATVRPSSPAKTRWRCYPTIPGTWRFEEMLIQGDEGFAFGTNDDEQREVAMPPLHERITQSDKVVA